MPRGSPRRDSRPYVRGVIPPSFLRFHLGDGPLLRNKTTIPAANGRFWASKCQYPRRMATQKSRPQAITLPNLPLIFPNLLIPLNIPSLFQPFLIPSFLFHH